jgi:hypothetical protein
MDRQDLYALAITEIYKVEDVSQTERLSAVVRVSEAILGKVTTIAQNDDVKPSEDIAGMMQSILQPLALLTAQGSASIKEST